MSNKHQVIPIENISSMIFTIRNVQVMVDKDLAEVYQVETKVLNQAVKRNLDRFPKEFRFQLTESEQNELVTNGDRFGSLNTGLRSQSVILKGNLKSQIVTSSLGQHGGRRKRKHSVNPLLAQSFFNFLFGVGCWNRDRKAKHNLKGRILPLVNMAWSMSR